MQLQMSSRQKTEYKMQQIELGVANERTFPDIGFPG